MVVTDQYLTRWRTDGRGDGSGRPVNGRVGKDGRTSRHGLDVVQTIVGTVRRIVGSDERVGIRLSGGRSFLTGRRSAA